MSLGSFEIDISADVSEAVSGLDDVASSATHADDATQDLNQGTGDASQGFGGLETAAVGAAAAVGGLMVAGEVATQLMDAASAAFDFTVNMAGARDEIDKTSATMGLSVEEFQRYEFIASQTGVGMRELQRATVEYDGDLMDLATRVANASDQQEAMAIATDELGNRLGSRLMPMLREGGDELQALGDRADEAGIIMGEDAVAAGAEFEDQLDLLSRRADATKQELAGLIIESENLEGVFDALHTASDDLSAALGELDDTAQSAADGGLELLDGAIRVNADRAERMILFYREMNGELEETEARSKRAAAASWGLTGAKTALGVAVPPVGLAMLALGRETDKYREAAQEAKEETEDLNLALNESTAIGQRLALAMEQRIPPTRESTETKEEHKEASEETSTAIEREIEVVQESADVWGDLSSALSDAADAADEQIRLQNLADEVELAERQLAIIEEQDAMQSVLMEKEQARLEFQREMERINREGLEGDERRLAMLEAEATKVATIQGLERQRLRMMEQQDDALSQAASTSTAMEQSDDSRLNATRSILSTTQGMSGALLDAAGAGDELADSMNTVLSTAMQVTQALGAGGLTGALGVGGALVGGVSRLVGRGSGTDPVRDTGQRSQMREMAELFAEAFVEEQERHERPVLVELNMRDAPRNETSRFLMGLIEPELTGQVGGS